MNGMMASKTIGGATLPPAGSREGKIIILRYNEKHESPWLTTTQMSYTAALVNATQAPYSGHYIWRNNACHNLSTNNREHLRMESLLHALVITGALGGLPLSEAPLMMKAQIGDIEEYVPNYVYYNGDPSESADFMSQSPPFFFVNCELNRTDIDGYCVTTRLAAPVFQKRDHYFMCSGESNSNVYRISDPVNTFFTADGLKAIEAILSMPYKESNINFGGDVRVRLPTNPRGAPHEVLCVPKLFSKGYPLNRWDDCTDRDEIVDTCLPYRVCDSLTSPTGDNRFGIQVIDLGDTDAFVHLNIG